MREWKKNKTKQNKTKQKTVRGKNIFFFFFFSLTLLNKNLYSLKLCPFLLICRDHIMIYSQWLKCHPILESKVLCIVSVAKFYSLLYFVCFFQSSETMYSFYQLCSFFSSENGTLLMEIFYKYFTGGKQSMKPFTNVSRNKPFTELWFQ